MYRPVDHHIDLVNPNSILPKSQLYQISEDELRVAKDTIDDYLARSWIRPSYNSYKALVIVIHKNTGELRIAIDYLLLNKQTRLDLYRILCTDELLDCLDHIKYFTRIDFASGYHQVKLAIGHEKKTAFFTRYGTYEWLVLPLGLTYAPAMFQRLMDGIFHDLLNKSPLVYLDDLLVQSNTDVQHLEDIRQILQHLRDNKLKAKKCDFNAQYVEYLEHIVSNGTVTIDPTKVSAVKEWLRPMSVKQLQSFLSFCNYYNRYIKSYSRIIAPMTKLLQKDASFTWGTQQQQSFEELVHVLTSAPVLQMP